MTSTLEDVAWRSERPLPTWAKRATVGLLFLLVVAGAIGVFGVHARTVRSSGTAGFHLEVTYPRTARAGLDVPWRITVTRDRPLPEQLTLAVSGDYFRMFESQGFYPEADSETRDGSYVYFTFTTAPGSDKFVWDSDTYVQPSAQLGKSATVRVIADGDVVAQTSFRTWLVP